MLSFGLISYFQLICISQERYYFKRKYMTDYDDDKYLFYLMLYV